MGKTVIAFFPDANSADTMMQNLLDAGHSPNDVKVFSDTASGEGPAGGPADATGASLTGESGASTLGHNYFSLRNAPIMISVAVPEDRADAVARTLRDHGARDVQIREANWNDTAAGKNVRPAGRGALGAMPPKPQS
ncbi:MAG TPA: hypothetical protein VN428_24140 [Bryobacteraceae bacterium]|nr:hypothetical protein [Bryobacteraceae bacterium]